MPRAIRMMANPGMVFVKGNGGGIGRLRRKAANVIANPAAICAP